MLRFSIPTAQFVCSRVMMVLTLTFAGCSTALVTRSTPDRDAALLVHLIADADSVRDPVLDTLISDPPSPDAPIRFDPRPLRRAEEPADSAEPWFAVAGPNVVRWRANLILNTGADTSRVLSLSECPRRNFSDTPRPGCPRVAELVVASGRLAPRRVVHDTSARIVRVQWFELDPRGQRIWEYRYVVRWTDGRWWTLERLLVGLID